MTKTVKFSCDVDDKGNITNIKSTIIDAPLPVPEIPPYIVKKIPLGKGMLIWRLNTTGNGDMVQMAEQAKAANYNWVSIKVVERVSPYNKDLIVKAVEALKARNINVWGWGYTYGDNPLQEAKATVEIVKGLGLDGYFIDAELEWKNRPDGATKATIYSNELRNGLPNAGIGFCSYRYPLYHPLPWKEFLSISDFHAPQVYWIGDNRLNGPEIQLKSSYNQLRALRDIPYIPIGISTPHTMKDSAGREFIWSPKVEQLDNFDTASKTQGYLGVGWYEWKPAFDNQVWWKTLAKHDWTEVLRG